MRLPLLFSTAMIATTILGVANAYGQCAGDYCPIPNAYYNQSAPSRYGYDHAQGNQNPNWQGNQSPDWRNDNGSRATGGDYYNRREQNDNDYYFRNTNNTNSNQQGPSSTQALNNNPSSNYYRNDNGNGQGYYYSSNANATPSMSSNPNNAAGQTSSSNTQNAGPDSLVQHRVEDALKNNYLKKNYNDVNARVYNGTVTLSGTVESEEERQDVESRIRGVTGVNNVNDQLQITPKTSSNDSKSTDESAEANSDTSIQKQVDDALKNNYVKKNFDAVTATVSNGVVTLTGTVDNDKDRQEIRDRLQKIKGVSNVTDNLQVSGATSFNNGKKALNLR